MDKKIDSANSKNTSKFKKDIILIVTLLTIALSLSIFFYQKNHGLTANNNVKQEEKRKVVTIKVNKEKYYEGYLDEDKEIEVSGYQGGFNKVSIKSGKVTVTEADCPDHICEESKAISEVGETIVCLPHRMVVEIDGAHEGLDGYAK